MQTHPTSRRAVAGLVVAAWLCAATPAAQAVSATASVDWGALAVTLVDTDPRPGPDVSSTTIAQYAWHTCTDTGVGACPVPEPAPNLSPLTVAGATFQGIGQFDDDVLSASFDGTLPVNGSIGIRSGYSFAFFIAGPATLTFTLPYTLTVDGTLGSATDGAAVSVGLLGSSGTVQRVLSTTFNDGVRTQTGLLTGTVAAADALWFAGFAVDVTAELRHTGQVVAPVPEPGPLALVSTGLVWLACCAKRRGQYQDESVPSARRVS